MPNFIIVIMISILIYLTKSIGCQTFNIEKGSSSYKNYSRTESIPTKRKIYLSNANTRTSTYRKSDKTNMINNISVMSHEKIYITSSPRNKKKQDKQLKEHQLRGQKQKGAEQNLTKPIIHHLRAFLQFQMLQIQK
jgi:hypothetical protein